MAIHFDTHKLLRFFRLCLLVLAGLYLYSVVMANRGGFASDSLYRQWLETACQSTRADAAADGRSLLPLWRI